MQKITITLLCVIIGAYLLLLAAANLPPSRRFLARVAQEVLSEKLHTRVVIEDVGIGLFNRVILYGVTVDDQSRKPLLHAETASAKLELRSLFRKQISLRTISLLDAELTAYKAAPNAPANYQFMLDAFKSKDKKSRTSLDLRINSLILRRVNIKYDEHYRKRLQTSSMLDFSHLHLTDLNASLSLKTITPDTLNLRVRSLSLKESCGLRIENLRLKLAANRQRAEVQDFFLATPNSQFTQNHLSLAYEARSGWGQLWPTLHIQGQIKNARIFLPDVAHFVKLPTRLKQTAVIRSTRFTLTSGQFALKELLLQNSERTVSIETNADIRFKKGQSPMAVRVKDFSLTAKSGALGNVLSQVVDLGANKQDILHRLGRVQIEAKGAVVFSKALNGGGEMSVNTDAGKMYAQVHGNGQKWQTDVKFTEVMPSYILANTRYPELATLRARGNVTLGRKKGVEAVSGDVAVQNVVWNHYAYHDISLKGHYTGSLAHFELNSHDPNVNLTARGSMNLRQGSLQGGEVTANVRNLTPSLLGVSTPYGSASFRAEIESSYQKESPSAFSGNVGIKNFQMSGGERGEYALNSMQLTLSPPDEDQRQTLCIKSDFADAVLEGNMRVQRLMDGVRTLMARALPGLLPRPSAETEDIWRITAQIRPSDFIQKMLGVNLSLSGTTSLSGTLDTGEGRTSLTAYADGFTINDNSFRKTTAYIEGNDDQYHCLLQTSKKIGPRTYSVAADLHTKDSLLHTQVEWASDARRRYTGELSTTMRFYPREKGGVDFQTQIHPTEFYLGDSLWHIASGELSLRNKELVIRSLSVQHRNQGLSVDGRLSPQRNDSIVANLRAIDVDYILGLVDFHAVEFGGEATGNLVFTNTASNPQLHADLHIPDFLFNDTYMGETAIKGRWNATDKRIMLDADMQLPDNEGSTHVVGYVSPPEKSLSLNITASQTNLQFLQRYMDGIFSDFEGSASGEVRLFGPFKQLDFQGELTAKAKAHIDAIGVAYMLDGGKVHVSPGVFAFDGFSISDGRGGKGTASGKLMHNHLKNLSYDLSVEAQHMLVYDQPQTHDLPFYSTTTGSGRIHLLGFPGRLRADINLVPEAPTQLTYEMGTATPLGTDNSLMRFHDGQHKLEQAMLSDGTTQKGGIHSPLPQEAQSEPAEQDLDVTLNIMVEMNPSAQVTIVTDPRADDRLTVYGEGPIRAVWHNKGGLDMFGNYRLTRGTYKLSIQDVIRKDLTLQPGSYITFTGQPLKADLNLNAIYTVNGVSLSDLNYGAGFSQKSVRVDCILNISGKAQSPQVSFDLDLHNISDDEKYMVRQLIATDEDMSRQVIYLLGIGRFYTANATGSVGTSGNAQQQQSAAAMRSFLSTTLTSQLNAAISSALGSQSHWSFGTNVSPGTLGWSDMEVDGLLQGRLFNDRLLINGNFGYRDRPTYASNFVGDFDIRYLLTPRGSISLRAYSETTDRYFTKSSLTTQGLGISLKRDFSNFRDLFVPQFKRKKKEKE